MTYLGVGAGWWYPATVIDLATRRLIGWSITTHLRTTLVVDALDALDALDAAVAARGGRVDNAIFHSDRSSPVHQRRPRRGLPPPRRAPLAKSLPKTAEVAGAGYVMLGNLYAYGPTPTELSSSHQSGRCRQRAARGRPMLAASGRLADYPGRSCSVAPRADLAARRRLLTFMSRATSTAGQPQSASSL
ncbi:DDE-type integrase/transposase/recombinase [Micromonospora sp. NPDC005806]|uniref:DDE-type integrase/transposase/recombinase n=1 Tax=Micromonospora sp. NPDC005806 TaxID=3364234 RepID=UPI0036A3E0B3